MTLKELFAERLRLEMALRYDVVPFEKQLELAAKLVEIKDVIKARRKLEEPFW